MNDSKANNIQHTSEDMPENLKDRQSNRNNSVCIYYRHDTDLPVLEEWAKGMDAESVVVLKEKTEAS